MSSSLLFAVVLLSTQVVLSTAQSKICTSPTNTFTVKVDLHASERGHYYFEECGKDYVNPTIGLEFGVVYTFIQEDRTNFWHPMEFSYYPDGVHLGADLLDPRVDKGANNNNNNDNEGDSCAQNMTCPAPMYFLNDGLLGSYSNIPEIEPITTNEADNGVQVYDDFFFQNMKSWKGMGTFSIKLKFDEQTYTDSDLFYYCHIHPEMSGRIKLLKNGQPVNPRDLPAMYFARDTISQYDQMCGTYNLQDYQLPHPECPQRFVCDAEPTMMDFASCIDSMNCLMVKDMTTKATTDSPLVLFIHQMIPHHQNAVNMAKALLKAAFLPCDDLTDTQDPYCIMQGVLYNIVNKQNYEIGVMYRVLSQLNAPVTDDCQVLIPNQDDTSSAYRNNQKIMSYVILGSVLLAAMAFL